MKTKVISKTAKNRCNCVLYARAQAKFKFPFGLWTLADKKAIINYSKPIAGAVAMTSDGIWYIRNGKRVFSGHTAIVESVKGSIITIREANYKRCLITRRSGTAKELKIVGYRVDKVPPKPQEASIKHDWKKECDRLHLKLIECNKRRADGQKAYSSLKISHLELAKSREKLKTKYNILAEDYGKLKEVETKYAICDTAKKDLEEKIKNLQPVEEIVIEFPITGKYWLKVVKTNSK